MTEDQILKSLTLAGIAHNPRPGKNNSIKYIATNCPYCSDSSGHGGFKKTTGSYHCQRCKETKSLWGFMTDGIGVERTKDIFIEVGIFEKRKINPSKEEDIEKLVNDILFTDTDRKVEPATPKEFEIQGAKKTLLPKETLALVKSEEAMRYLMSTREIPLKHIPDLIRTTNPLVFPQTMSDPRFSKSFLYGMRNRIVFPITIYGELVSWSARDFTGTSLRRYLTPPPSMCVTVTQRTVFPFDFLRSSKGELLLIQEGVFDSVPFNLVADTTGVYSCCCFTNNLTPGQVLLLKHLSKNFKHTAVLYDKGEDVSSLRAFLSLSEKISNLRRYFIPKHFKDTGQIPVSRINKVAEYLLKNI